MYSQRGSAYSNMVVAERCRYRCNGTRRTGRTASSRRALALAEQVRAEREDALREHRAEIAAWLQEWHSARERLAATTSSADSAGRERTQAALAAYRGGSGALAAVLEARRAEIDAAHRTAATRAGQRRGCGRS